MTEDDVLKLTIDEYRRGVVSWRVAGQAVVRVRVPDEDGADGDWSIPLTNHHGSLSPVRFSPGVQIGIVPSDSVTLNQPIRVRWHALVEQEAVTAIWDALDSPPVLLSGVPDFGHFYRMTVTTPWLTWEEEATVWEGSTTLSFRRLPELGQIWVPTEPTEPGQLPRQLEVVPSVVNRGTIEIVTPGAPPGNAVQASAVLGFIALVIGDEAVGPIRDRQNYEAKPEETRLVAYPMGPMVSDGVIRPILNVSSSVIDLIAEYLPVVLGFGMSSRRSDSLRVALSAFERAARSRDVLERFLAFFVGIETIATAFAVESGLHGLFAPLKDDSRFHKLLADLSGEYKAKDLKRLQNGLGLPSNPERFGHYAKHYGIRKELRRSFHRLNRLRNDIAHGNSAQVELEDAQLAKALLVEVLKIEIGLPSPLPWETNMQFDGLRVGGTVSPVSQGAHGWLSTIQVGKLEKL